MGWVVPEVFYNVFFVLRLGGEGSVDFDEEGIGVVADGRLLPGGLSDEVEGELVEGVALQAGEIDAFGEFCCGFAGVADEEDFSRVDAFDLSEVFDFPDDGGGFPAACAADDEAIVFF